MTGEFYISKICERVYGGGNVSSKTKGKSILINEVIDIMILEQEINYK